MQVNTQFPEQQHPEEITIKSLKVLQGRIQK